MKNIHWFYFVYRGVQISDFFHYFTNNVVLVITSADVVVIKILIKINEVLEALLMLIQNFRSS